MVYVPTLIQVDELPEGPPGAQQQYRYILNIYIELPHGSDRFLGATGELS